MTQELVEEGKEHMKREKRRRQRIAESASRRKEFSDRFGPSEHIDVSGIVFVRFVRILIHYYGM